MTTSEIARPTATEIDELKETAVAPVWRPGERGYADAVSTWNLGVQLKPAAVLVAHTAVDVAAGVRWAARHGVPVGAHATGHGAVANADGALLINTSGLDTVEIDARAGVATVGAGVRLARLTTAAAVHGLATVQGSSGSVSVAGFVSGGGLGVLSRTYGLAADHVLSIDVVTAEGRLRTVDGRHDPDLFWALRGGKGNFGVITGLRLSLIPLTAFYGGGLFFDGAHASTVLHGYQRWITSHTDRTSSSVALLRLPPDPGLPDALRGRFVVHVRMAHVGDHEEGARLAADIRGTAPVLLDLIGELTPAAMDAVHQDPPGPMPTYEQGCLLEELTPDTIDAILAHTAAVPDSPLVLTEIRHLGGAIARRPYLAGAAPGGAAAFSLFTIAPDLPPLAQAGPAAVAALLTAVERWRSAGAMPNFLGRCSEPERVVASWPPEARDRLLTIKQRWDPHNLFRLGHGIVGTRRPARPDSIDESRVGSDEWAAASGAPRRRRK